jgi:hypothetical protein
MKIVEDRFKLEMSDWEKRTFGDMNIAHTERFNEIGYPNPSAPSVFLLYRAEKFMAENYMMPAIPFDMEMTLPYPAFPGNYICRQKYPEDNGPIHVEFEQANDGIVASMLFENYDSTNQRGNGTPKLVSHDFGDFIHNFFEHEDRIGAVLGQVNMRFYDTPEARPLELDLSVDRNEKRGGRIRNYHVNGIGSQGLKGIIEITSARFVKKIFQ